MTKVLVCGAGGFIGAHLVRRLKELDYWVRGVDLRRPPFSQSVADEFIIADLRDPCAARGVLEGAISQVFQFAADMGGAGFVFTGEHDADIVRNSVLVNVNMLDAARHAGVGKILFASSACVYPEFNQRCPETTTCREDTAYPASPDSEYGWEKLFSERLYLSYMRNHGLNVHIARYHNVFGEEGAWEGGREKAPAALCRKVAEVADGGVIDIWGDGEQARSFLYIDECLEGTLRLANSTFSGPVNIGSDEMVTINTLLDMLEACSGKRVQRRYVDGPTGVRGRTSDNALIMARLNWRPRMRLRDGLDRTYRWISMQVAGRQAVQNPHDATIRSGGGV